MGTVRKGFLCLDAGKEKDMEGKVCIMAAMMRFFRPFFVLMLSGAACMAAQGQEQIIPRPVSVKYGETGPEGAAEAWFLRCSRSAMIREFSF